jgi:hypothetical protein
VDTLDLLFRRIVLAAHAAGALERPLTVGEILETFAPYASAKRDGPIPTHDDYLQAVMELVAGERSLVFADDLMQDDLKAELASPNPDVTVIRTYANTKVRLSTGGVQRVLAGDTSIDLRPPTPLSARAVIADPLAPAAARPMAKPAVPPAAPPAPTTPITLRPAPEARVSHAGAPIVAKVQPPPGVAPGPVPQRELVDAYAPAAAAATEEPGCPYCSSPIPQGRAIRFCPACGQNLTVRRCAGCSAEIESGWKFCVTCGRSAR